MQDLSFSQKVIQARVAGLDPNCYTITLPGGPSITQCDSGVATFLKGVAVVTASVGVLYGAVKLIDALSSSRKRRRR